MSEIKGFYFETEPAESKTPSDVIKLFYEQGTQSQEGIRTLSEIMFNKNHTLSESDVDSYYTATETEADLSEDFIEELSEVIGEGATYYDGSCKEKYPVIVSAESADVFESEVLGCQVLVATGTNYSYVWAFIDGEWGLLACAEVSE